MASAGIYLALLMDPQWYVVDFAGFLAGGALIAILGISFGIRWAFVILGALMVYDAIAVYRTKHMVSLADVVTEMKLPILMVMPDSRRVTTTRPRPSLKEQRGQPVEERAAMFMGLGDIVIPGDAGRLGVRLAPDLCPPPRGSGRTFVIAARRPARLARRLQRPHAARARRKPAGGSPAPERRGDRGYLLAYFLVFRSFTFGLTGGL